MNRNLLAGALAFPALLTPALALEGAAAERSKPLNIIHIMSDDHSYQAVGAYGHPITQVAPTPNLDRLARMGTTFQRAYVENSLSTPSRACLITGLYSHQNGQRQLGKGIDSTKTFFSELLQAQGYQTGVIGKWHMKCEPKGFDFYYVLNDQGQYYNPGFKTPDSHGKYVREEGYVTTLTTDHALEFLEERDESQPFCLLVHYKAPHRNWMPEPKYLHLYDDVEFPEPETLTDDFYDRGPAPHGQEMSILHDMQLASDLKVYKASSENPSWDGMLTRMNPEQRAAWIEAYKQRGDEYRNLLPDADKLLRWKYQCYLRDYMRCIRSIDDQVGRLLDYLEKEGLLENTIVVYTSDQGFYMGEHGWFDKRFMYEESFRTPLIAYYPGGPQGVTCDELVQNIDYAPTYLTAAGVDVPEQMTGRPLQPLMKGEKPAEWRKYLYYHYYDYPAVHRVHRHDGVSDGRWKLIHFYGLEDIPAYGVSTFDELYDLENDPHELHNIYGQPGTEQVIERLQKQLDTFRRDLAVDEW